MTSLLSFLKRLWPWARPRHSRAQPPMDFAGPEVPIPETSAPEAETEAVAPDKPDVVEPELVETHHAEPATVVEPREEDTAEAVNDNEEWEEDEDAHDPDEEVFIEDADELGEAVSPARMAIERDLAEALRLRRAEALAAALIGEHRIYLSDPTGPGSLAEALNILVQQGRVTAEFQDEGEAGAFILYRPVGG